MFFNNVQQHPTTSNRVLNSFEHNWISRTALHRNMILVQVKPINYVALNWKCNDNETRNNTSSRGAHNGFFDCLCVPLMHAFNLDFNQHWLQTWVSYGIRYAYHRYHNPVAFYTCKLQLKMLTFTHFPFHSLFLEEPQEKIGCAKLLQRNYCRNCVNPQIASEQKKNVD